MIFLTTGTQFAFDRLVEAVDQACSEGLLDQDVFAQIGESRYRPRAFRFVLRLGRADYTRWMDAATAVIGHAGMGTITEAMDRGKPLLVMPRLKRFGEVVNDHQVDITRRFAEAGHVLAVYDAADIPEGIQRLKTFVPRPREASPQAVAERIRRFLDDLQTRV
jgi:UDP-N-acetylglucosamine transferase subunit ALG13